MLCFYYSTIEHSFKNGSYLNLLKLKGSNTLLSPFNMNRMKNFNVVYKIKKEKTVNCGVVDGL